MRAKPLSRSRLSSIFERFRSELPRFEEIHKGLYEHPELGLSEQRKASIAARFLRDHGFEVHEGIGGYGVAGTLSRRIPGRTVLLEQT